jgi:hypothetical protein
LQIFIPFSFVSIKLEALIAIFTYFSPNITKVMEISGQQLPAKLMTDQHIWKMWVFKNI